MIVNFARKLRLLSALLLLAAVIGRCAGIEQCKVGLLKHFGLSPLKYPVASSMVVCGNITENCCSMEDELRIYKLWKSFSVSQITKHVDLLVKNYAALFDYHNELLAVDFGRVEVRATETRQIPFKIKVCERAAHQLEKDEKALNEMDLLNNNGLLEDNAFRKAVADGKMGDGQNLSLSKDDNVGDEVARDITLVNGLPAKGRVLQEAKTGVDVDVSEAALRNYVEPKNKLAEVEKQLSQSMLSLSSPVAQIGESGAEPTLSGSTERALKQQPKKVKATKKKKRSHKTNLKKKHAPAYEENSFSRPFVFEEELPERKVQCTYLDRIVQKKVTVVNKFKLQFCTDLRQKLQKFRIADFRAYLPDVKLEMNRMMNLKKSFYCYLCDIEKQKRIDAENAIVTFDNHFCRRLVIDFRDYIKFQNVLLIEYVDLVLQYVRCFQTSADEARFPYSSFLLMYQKNFETIQSCFDNIDGPDFMKHCVFLCQQYSYTTFSKFFDGNQDLINRILMTLTSFFRKLRANQALSVDYKAIKKEFDLIDNINLNIDVEDLKTGVNASSVNIGENGHKATLQKHDEPNSKDKKTKSVSHHAVEKSKRDLHDDKGYDLEASRIEHMTKEQYHNYMIERTYNQTSSISWEKEPEEPRGSIYETSAPHFVTRVFRSRFVNDFNALDPLEVEPQLNFSINIKMLIKLQCDKNRKNGDQPETLQQEVIHEYFNANDEDVHSFATDLFMPFTDYAYFQKKHLEPEEKKVVL